MSIRDILTEDEIDTLLREDVAKMPQPEQAVYDGVPINFYDFISEYHKSIIKSRGFKILNNNFAAELSNLFSEKYRFKVTVTPLESDVSTYETYFKNHQTDTIVNLLKISGKNKFTVISLSKKLINLAIELLFGSKPNDSSLTTCNTGFVGMEISKQTSIVIAEILTRVYNPIAELKWEHIKTTDENLTRTISNNNEKIIIQPFQICVDDLSAQFELTLPHTLFNDISGKLTANETNDNDHIQKEEWSSALKHTIFNTKLNLSAEITETSTKLKDIIHLQVGDIISIDNPQAGYLLVEGVKLFKVRCCARDGAKVVEILEPIND